MCPEVASLSALLPQWDVEIGIGRGLAALSPGSRGTLPCPSPLRTARESFPSSRSSLFNALYRDAASPPKVPGYGLAYGNLDEVARGSPADLPLRLLDVRYGDCSIP